VKDVVAGINPKTRECTVVGIDDVETWAEIRRERLIAVFVSPEVAREIFTTTVPDVYALTKESP